MLGDLYSPSEVSEVMDSDVSYVVLDSPSSSNFSVELLDSFDSTDWQVPDDHAIVNKSASIEFLDSFSSAHTSFSAEFLDDDGSTADPVQGICYFPAASTPLKAPIEELDQVSAKRTKYVEGSFNIMR